MDIYGYSVKARDGSEIKLNVDGNVVINISFTGGRNGHLKGIPLLVDGQWKKSRKSCQA